MAGCPVGLVGEDFGSVVAPAEGVGAEEALVSVVRGLDWAAFDECLFEDRPGWWLWVRGHGVGGLERLTRTAWAGASVGCGQAL